MAVSSSGVQVAVIGGPALGGLLYTQGASTVYLTCAGLLVLSCALALAVHYRHQPATDSATWRTVLAGVEFVWRHKLLLGATSLDLFAVLLGGLIGGPVARHLLAKVRKTPGAAGSHQEPTLFEHPAEVRLITAPALIETLALISVCLLAGQHIARALAGTFLELPAFVCVLFVGVVLRNGLAAAGKYTVFERAVSVLGNVSLALFLALALMSMRLWELSSLALPMLGLLLGQTVLMAAYAIFVTFPVMGRNYDAAVIAAGHCGFGLGATPTAIANMQAVTDRFGNSPLAFLVVPMVGAFFIDLANALVIKLFLLLPLH